MINSDKSNKHVSILDRGNYIDRFMAGIREPGRSLLRSLGYLFISCLIAYFLWPRFNLNDIVSLVLFGTMVACFYFAGHHQGCARGWTEIQVRREETDAMTRIGITDIDWSHPDTKMFVTGVGTSNCSNYLSNINDPIRRSDMTTCMYDSWRQGYLGAFNCLLDDEVVDLSDCKWQKQWLDRFSRDNPTETFDVALRQLWNALREQQKLEPDQRFAPVKS